MRKNWYRVVWNELPASLLIEKRHSGVFPEIEQEFGESDKSLKHELG